MAKLSAMQNLMRARMAVLNHDKWKGYRGALMYGAFALKDCGTAYTNGRDSFFDEKFCNTLTDAQLRFLVLHENEHKVQRHLDMYQFLRDRDHDDETLNRAMDYCANIRLMDIDADEEFIQFIDGGCLDEKFRGWSTHHIYEELRKEQKENGKCNGRDGEPTDEHGHDEAQGFSDDEKKQVKRDIDRVLRQGNIFGKNGSGDEERLLDGLIEPTINWREELAEFVKSFANGKDNSSWSRLNRRFVYQGMYLPSTVSETIGRMLLGIDASGSTWYGNQLEGFCSELVGLAQECKPEAIDVVWWDTGVTSVQHFTPEDYDSLYSKLQIKGGGGTAPSCVTDWMADPKQQGKNYCAAIMLSDGNVGDDWGGDWPVPVLWCLNQKGITAGTGKTLYIEDTTR